MNATTVVNHVAHSAGPTPADAPPAAGQLTVVQQRFVLVLRCAEHGSS